MKKILFCIFLGFPLSLFAQGCDSASVYADSVRQEAILQNRRLLLEKFRANRLDSVSHLLDSLDRYPEIPVLWPAERLLLYFWIERYAAIDSLALHFDEFCRAASRNHPPDQAVWNVLSYHAGENTGMLVEWIGQSGCPDDESDFLAGLLKFMVQGDRDNQMLINKETASFINRNIIRKENTAGETETVASEPVQSSQDNDEPWLVGFGIGAGPVFLSGKIADYLSPRAGLSFNFNVNYNRWYFAFSMQALFAELKRDIPLNNGIDVWEAGQSAVIGNFGLSVGYSVVNNKYFRISPYVGLSVSECSPSEQAIEDNTALEDAAIRWGYSAIYGLDMDFKFYNLFDALKQKSMLSSFRIGLAYNPAIFSKVNSRYSGDVLFITFGINLDNLQ